jgi:two-component system alkaline phosphatase synthesis response regulator PhoP
VDAKSPVVLIVDDHEDSLAMYAFGLLAMGFLPVLASSGEDAFTRACEIRPDVIVATVRLAGLSGIDLIRQLRGDARTRESGIVMLAGPAESAMQRQAHAAGCDRVLPKRCMPDALAFALRDVIVARRRRSEVPTP